jgi:hypothetical protein
VVGIAAANADCVDVGCGLALLLLQLIAIGAIQTQESIDRVWIRKATAITQTRSIGKLLTAATEQVEIRDKLGVSPEKVAELTRVEDFPLQGDLLKGPSHCWEYRFELLRLDRPGRPGQQNQRQHVVEREQVVSPPKSGSIRPLLIVSSAFFFQRTIVRQ